MNRILKSTAVVAAATVGLLSGVGPAAADAVEVNERVGKALVFLQMTISGQVQIPFTNGAQWTADLETGGTCSGYVVDKTGFIATAGHCVYTDSDSTKNSLREQAVIAIAKAQNKDEAWATNIYRQAVQQAWAVRGAGGEGDKPSVSVKVKQPSGPNQVIREWTTVQVVAAQSLPDGDNAVLKMNSVPGELTPLVVSDVAPKAGEAITSVGFPGQVRRVSDDTTLPQPSFKSGTVSSRQQSGQGAMNTEVSATIGKGMSGGPTVNANGEVVGTNSWKPSKVVQDSVGGESSEFGFITDNLGLRRFLQSNGVTLATAEKPSSGVPLLVWLGPLIGLGVLVLIVGLVLGLRRKKPAAPVYPAQTGVPGPGFGQQPPTNPSPFGPPQTPPGQSNQNPFMPPPPR